MPEAYDVYVTTPRGVELQEAVGLSASDTEDLVRLLWLFLEPETIVVLDHQTNEFVIKWVRPLEVAA